MLALWRRYNYRLALLGTDSFVNSVQVLEPGGRLWLAEWQGFISADAARSLENARSVRLVIELIDSAKLGGHGRRRLTADEYLQGCVVDRFAWAVVDHRVRIVPGPKRELRR